MNKHIIIYLLFISAISCRKFVAVTPPDTAIEASRVFESDISATSAVTSILADMSAGYSFSQGFGGVSILTAMTGDELNTKSLQLDYQQIYTNTVLSDNGLLTTMWETVYKYVYSTNDIIDRVGKSTSLSERARQQILGEAYFLRAFMYFHLVNLYGDVPLILGTDYRVNLVASRQPVTKVMEQVVDDLKQAQSMLTDDYADNNLSATTDRIRPNKWAATAMLARVYLYQKDWQNAEAQASDVIQQSSMYTLDEDLDIVFKQGSHEVLWHLPPPVYTGMTSPITYNQDGYSFSADYLKSFGVGPQSFAYQLSYYLNDDFVALFESGDKRLSWIDTLPEAGVNYYVPYKYKIGILGGGTADYLVVLRLAEQYLIRAEARLMQNNLEGAKQDLNTLRQRAGLGGIAASTPQQVMASIENERKKELFTEWGHRWFDLKRWQGIDDPGISRAEEVMKVVTPRKGGIWNPDWLVYPIPQKEVRNGPNMTQNAGYN